MAYEHETHGTHPVGANCVRPRPPIHMAYEHENPVGATRVCPPRTSPNRYTKFPQMCPMETRKHNRLTEYDYSQNGYYFITICTAEKQKMLCDISVGIDGARPQTTLTEIGKLVAENIGILNGTYETVRVDKYVVMPNHVHLILTIQNGRTQFAPTVSRIVKQFKGTITKQLGFGIWQKSFYDHIIRDEEDYLRIWEYIDNNPAKWAEDKYCI